LPSTSVTKLGKYKVKNINFRYLYIYIYTDDITAKYNDA